MEPGEEGQGQTDTCMCKSNYIDLLCLHVMNGNTVIWEGGVEGGERGRRREREKD